MTWKTWFHKKSNRVKTLSPKKAKFITAAVIAIGSFIPFSIWGAEELQQSVQFSYSDAIGDKNYKGLLMPGEAPVFPFSPAVTTTLGAVRGEIVGSAIRWRGIPYAVAPRWKAPEDVPAWEGVKETKTYASQFMQMGQDFPLGTDDELTVDVYRPNNSDSNLPIMLYLHGGSNQTGSSAEFDAGAFAVKANVIVVSVNYRLGLFGFINLPALKTGDPYTDSGNFALLDIQKALNWTINNALIFGGNFKNITVVGFDSGSRDALAMVISPLTKGKFQKVIALHGGMTTAEVEASQKSDARILSKLAVDSGKFSSREEAEKWLLSSNEDVKTWLHSIRSTTLAQVLSPNSLRMAKFPQLFADGVVLPYQGFDTAEYNQVPVMLISAHDEFSIFAGEDPKFAADYKDSSILLRKESADLLDEFKFTNKYGSMLNRYFNTSQVAEKMYPRYQMPIYTAIINWGHNERFVGKNMQTLVGAYHGIGLALLAGRADQIAQKYPQAFIGQGYDGLKDAFQQYIANFVHTGNPNGNKLPTWAEWAPNDASELILDADSQAPIIQQSYKHLTYNEIINEMKTDTSINNFSKSRLIREVFSGRWWSESLDKEFGNVDFWRY